MCNVQSPLVASLFLSYHRIPNYALCDISCNDIFPGSAFVISIGGTVLVPADVQYINNIESVLIQCHEMAFK